MVQVKKKKKNANVASIVPWRVIDKMFPWVKWESSWKIE